MGSSNWRGVSSCKGACDNERPAPLPCCVPSFLLPRGVEIAARRGRILMANDGQSSVYSFLGRYAESVGIAQPGTDRGHKVPNVTICRFYVNSFIDDPFMLLSEYVVNCHGGSH